MAGAALLKFREDWSVEQSESLVAGGQAVVQYHRVRLAGREQLDETGEHNWVLSGFCSLNGNSPQTFLLGGRSSDEVAEQALALSESGTIELWFERSDLYGAHQYDSDYGRNFRFTVLPQKGALDGRSTAPLQVPERPTAS